MKYFFLISIMLFSIFAKSQYFPEIIEIKGRIISHQTHSSIPGAQYINVKKRTYGLADNNGEFHISMHRNDILRISSIGYGERFISFKDSIIQSDKVFVIELERKIYSIATVDIYEARWDDFKFDFEQVKLADNSTQDKIKDWISLVVDPYELSARKNPMPTGFGLSIPLSFKSKQEKQMIEVRDLEKKDAFQKIVENKYNRDLVSRITGLQNKELSDFMKYCNFPDQYILQSNSYDIILSIKRLYKDYQQK